MSLMNSSNSDPQKSQPHKDESPKKRIYLKQGILESNQDFAERMVRLMREAGILPSKKDANGKSPS